MYGHAVKQVGLTKVKIVYNLQYNDNRYILFTLGLQNNLPAIVRVFLCPILAYSAVLKLAYTVVGLQVNLTGKFLPKQNFLKI